MLRRIRNTQIGVLGGGVLAIILGTALREQGLALVFPVIWLILGHLAIRRLKCVRCGRRLSTVPPPLANRLFGLHTCAHCGEKQPP